MMCEAEVCPLLIVVLNRSAVSLSDGDGGKAGMRRTGVNQGHLTVNRA